MINNYFIELGETTFSAPSPLVHFKESLHGISTESLHSGKKRLVDLLLDLAKNQLWQLCQTVPGILHIYLTIHLLPAWSLQILLNLVFP